MRTAKQTQGNGEIFGNNNGITFIGFKGHQKNDRSLDCAVGTTLRPADGLRYGTLHYGTLRASPPFGEPSAPKTPNGLSPVFTA